VLIVAAGRPANQVKRPSWRAKRHEMVNRLTRSGKAESLAATLAG